MIYISIKSGFDDDLRCLLNDINLIDDLDKIQKDVNYIKWTMICLIKIFVLLLETMNDYELINSIDIIINFIKSDFKHYKTI